MPHREHVKTFFALRKQWIFCLFVQVCELDIIFNFEKAYFILDEFLMGGEIQDTSKKSVLKAIEQADLLQEVTWASPTTVGDVFSVWLSFSFNFLSLFWGGKESVFYIIRTLMRKLIISTYYRKSVRKLCYRLMGAHATTEWIFTEFNSRVNSRFISMNKSFTEILLILSGSHFILRHSVYDS